MVMMMMMMMMIRKKMARKLARRYRWRLGKSRSWEDTDRGQRLLRLLRLSVAVIMLAINIINDH